MLSIMTVHKARQRHAVSQKAKPFHLSNNVDASSLHFTSNGSSCQNTSYCKGVKMHYFPSNEEIRRKWVAFVRRHHHNWKPSSTLVLCSVHFEPTCYERRLDITGIPSELKLKKNRLLKDAVPTIDAVEHQAPKAPSARQRRQVGIGLGL